MTSDNASQRLQRGIRGPRDDATTQRGNAAGEGEGQASASSLDTQCEDGQAARQINVLPGRRRRLMDRPMNGAASLCHLCFLDRTNKRQTLAWPVCPSLLVARPDPGVQQNAPEPGSSLCINGFAGAVRQQHRSGKVESSKQPLVGCDAYTVMSGRRAGQEARVEDASRRAGQLRN
ncbi:hypothetical protein E4U21_000690 [Claviceps maximensis]|nr:hypothetical protein E4U21_000690 [Claviceps maximensis]